MFEGECETFPYLIFYKLYVQNISNLLYKYSWNIQINSGTNKYKDLVGYEFLIVSTTPSHTSTNDPDT